MQPRVAKFLWDVLDCCDRIERFTADMEFAAYEADDLVRSGVERQFEIAEALQQARRMEPELEQKISSFREIIDFRNRVIHAYFLIDHQIVWGIIHHDVPTLRRDIETLLHDQHGEEPQ